MFRANNAGGILAYFGAESHGAGNPKTRENDFATAKNRFAMGLRSATGIAVLRSNRVRGNAPSMEVRPALAMGLRLSMRESLRGNI